jgi:phage terminase large subunit-like protein
VGTRKPSFHIHRAKGSSIIQASTNQPAHHTSHEYLRYLQSKYSNVSVRAEYVGGESILQNHTIDKEGKLSMAIHPDALDRLANDPAAAAEFEKSLQSFIYLMA